MQQLVVPQGVAVVHRYHGWAQPCIRTCGIVEEGVYCVERAC
eukprot:COSAG06_NODE_435_length_15792_cov_21.516090_5_plen_42_part_00